MMAKEIIDDGEFWLPADFLSDEEKPNETESDEDESVAGLTRLLKSHSSLRNEPQAQNPKPVEMATSPQSTLCGMGGWSFSSNGGSPDGPSQVSSPPSTPFLKPRDDALDLLYAAAGRVERLGQISNGLLPPPPQEHPYQISEIQNLSTHELIQHQLQAARIYQLKKQQQLLKQQIRRQNRARNSARPLDLSSSAWPPLQKQQAPPQTQQKQPPLPGAGMTAVFLNGGRRQSNGTGVFLPRGVGSASPIEPRKKPSCSTVLLPARVVQALNLNLEDMGVHPRYPGCYVLDNDVAVARSNNMKRNQAQPAAAAAAAAASPELRLPQEWTY